MVARRSGLARRSRPRTRASSSGTENGLDDVIVGAGRKALHPFAFLAERGQHDDRKLPGFRPRPQPTAELNPRQARQHPVEHDEIRNAFL